MFNISINKKSLKILITLTISIMFIIVLFTLFLKNKDLNKLNQASKNIVHLNSSLKSKEKDGTFDSSSACKLLNSNKSSLDKSIANLNTLKLNDKNLETLKNQLYDYSKLNFKLYNSSLAILNNENAENFEKLYEDLIKSEKDVLLATDNLSKKGLAISFPKEANIFFSNINRYVNGLYKNNREKDIYDEQKRDFICTMNEILNDFTSLQEDFRPAISKIREDNRDLSILLCDINNKRSSFNDIKNKSYSVSIPVGTDKCYESLEEMLNSFESYINSFERNVKTEFNLSSNKKDNIESLYEDTSNKYLDFLECLDTFKTSIYSYKN
ncbi:hypothetical protein [Clostridium weizhouense]|uniref:Uncharacterized protein n=1 Tax=Clostridium weizhouense TaxID=2859781 RepID=A0ABS7ARZ9_9CLOT|nr:hypothetical protein [Clostridium weizhouense]MBW6410431.1 hypothetical protein [Clostridium weizhouense]